MNIRDLIETLSQLDPEMRVVVAGYEGGFNDITQIQPCEIRLNVHQDWFYGSHAKADDPQIQSLSGSERRSIVVLQAPRFNDSAQ
jgi:hypothetical protein